MSEEVPQQIHRLSQQARQLCEKGLYEEAIEIVIQGSDLALQAHDYDSYWQFELMLPDLYISTGNFAKAEPLLRKALEICGIMLGKTHPRYAC